MLQMFGFLGSILGYLLWGLFYIFKNFGVSIIFFTLIIRLILFPFSIKQQKSMANTARLQKKQKEIKEKYANNRQKQNEEMQKLYQQEGVSPTGGCLTSLVPMLIMLGIFYSVTAPLSNTLHIDKTVITNAMGSFNAIPGFSVADTAIFGNSATYQEFSFVRALADAQPVIAQIFPAGDAANVEMLVNGFNFLGLNFLSTPQGEGFGSIYIIIPILCFASSVVAQLVTMRINKQQQRGCMMFMMIGLPLFSAWISFQVPVAVGFYWICSSLFSMVQSIIMGKLYGPDALIARSEAQHVALLELQEAQIKPVK